MEDRVNAILAMVPRNKEIDSSTDVTNKRAVRGMSEAVS